MSVSAQDARAQSWAAHAAQPAERAPIDDSAPSGGPPKKPERVPLYDTVRSITEEPMYKYFDFWLSGPRSGAGMGPWTQGPVTEVSGKMAVVHLHQVPCGEEATAASHYSAVMGVMPTGFRKDPAVYKMNSKAGWFCNIDMFFDWDLGLQGIAPALGRLSTLSSNGVDGFFYDALLKQFAIGRGPPVLPTVTALAGVHSFATKPQALAAINASVCSALKDHAELRGRVCCRVVKHKDGVFVYILETCLEDVNDHARVRQLVDGKIFFEGRLLKMTFDYNNAAEATLKLDAKYDELGGASRERELWVSFPMSLHPRLTCAENVKSHLSVALADRGGGRLVGIKVTKVIGRPGMRFIYLVFNSSKAPAAVMGLPDPTVAFLGPEDARVFGGRFAVNYPRDSSRGGAPSSIGGAIGPAGPAQLAPGESPLPPLNYMELIDDAGLQDEDVAALAALHARPGAAGENQRFVSWRGRSSLAETPRGFFPGFDRSPSATAPSVTDSAATGPAPSEVETFDALVRAGHPEALQWRMRHDAGMGLAEYLQFR